MWNCKKINKFEIFSKQIINENEENMLDGDENQSSTHQTVNRNDLNLYDDLNEVN